MGRAPSDDSMSQFRVINTGGADRAPVLKVSFRSDPRSQRRISLEVFIPHCQGTFAPEFGLRIGALYRESSSAVFDSLRFAVTRDLKISCAGDDPNPPIPIRCVRIVGSSHHRLPSSAVPTPNSLMTLGGLVPRVIRSVRLKECRIDTCNPHIQFSKTKTHALCPYRQPHCFRSALTDESSMLRRTTRFGGSPERLINLERFGFGAARVDRPSDKPSPTQAWSLARRGSRRTSRMSLVENTTYLHKPLSVHVEMFQFACSRLGTLRFTGGPSWCKPIASQRWCPLSIPNFRDSFSLSLEGVRFASPFY